MGRDKLDELDRALRRIGELEAENRRVGGRLSDLEGMVAVLDSFQFEVQHHPGCGSPCDCGWDDLDRRMGEYFRRWIMPARVPTPESAGPLGE